MAGAGSVITAGAGTIFIGTVHTAGNAFGNQALIRAGRSPRRAIIITQSLIITSIAVRHRSAGISVHLAADKLAAFPPQPPRGRASLFRTQL